VKCCDGSIVRNANLMLCTGVRAADQINTNSDRSAVYSARRHSAPSTRSRAFLAVFAVMRIVGAGSAASMKRRDAATPHFGVSGSASL
jgi:hypothetical protein